jgi:hypothetical protein
MFFCGFHYTYYAHFYTEQQEYVFPAMGFPTQPEPSWYVHTLSVKK